MPVFNVSTEPLTQTSQLQADWLDLQSRSEASYFQSWGWINCWLEEVARDQDAEVLRVTRDNELVGLGIFVTAEISRRKIIHSRVMYLNAYPIADSDMVIEYNGLLAQAGCESDVFRHCLQYLSQQFSSIDEFNFGALSQCSFQSIGPQPVSELRCHIENRSQSWQVDLVALDSGIDAYLDTLSKNSRQQIRYSKRQYDNKSPVEISVAKDIEQALSYFDALKNLHVRRWEERSTDHAFNKRWEKFHRKIIRQRFLHGEIQLIKIANEQQEIAYLFNYVWRKRVYVLQMGFNYSKNKRLKPGYLAHAMAVVYNRDNGMSVYDFMHGYSRYKKSLSNMSETLTWCVFQRSRVKFKLEDIAVRLIRTFRRGDK